MRATLLGAIRLSREAAFQYLVAIFVLQGAIVVLAIPSIGGLFSLAMDIARLPNLTDRNLPQVLGHPLAALLLLAITIIALAAVAMQLATVIVMANRQQAALPLGVKEILVDVWKTVRRVAHYQSPLLFAYLFLLAPLGGFGLLSVMTRGISIPPFVTREFMKTIPGGAGYVIVIMIAMYVNMRLILTLPIIVVSGKSMLRAIGNSLLATSRQSGRLVLLVGGVVAAAMLLTTGVVELLVWVCTLADTASAATSLAVSSLCIGIGQVVAFLVIGAATVLISHLLVSMSREHLGLEVHAAKRIGRSARVKPGLKQRTAFVLTRFTALVVAVVISFTAAPAMASSDLDADQALVIGHRGYVGGGVENTIGGLEAAARVHPDLVETDMQQTKDGYFVASHDSNLLMVAGLNENIYDMTLAEATSTVEHEGGFTDTIPSMTEYVKRAAQLHVKLLIEIKVTGHESPDYIDKFLDTLDAAGVTDDNIYHSLDSSAVEHIKAKRPELKVGYTIAMTVGGVPSVPCDFLVVEQASYTPAFLAQAHAEGKPVYVWTVNNDVTIRDLLRDHVDGIVTDVPKLAIRDRSLVANEHGHAQRVHDVLDYLTVL